MSKVMPIRFTQKMHSNNNQTTTNKKQTTKNTIVGTGIGIALVASLPLTPLLWNGKVKQMRKGEILKGILGEYKNNIKKFLDAL